MTRTRDNIRVLRRAWRCRDDLSERRWSNECICIQIGEGRYGCWHTRGRREIWLGSWRRKDFHDDEETLKMKDPNSRKAKYKVKVKVVLEKWKWVIRQSSSLSRNNRRALRFKFSRFLGELSIFIERVSQFHISVCLQNGWGPTPSYFSSIRLRDHFLIIHVNKSFVQPQ